MKTFLGISTFRTNTLRVQHFFLPNWYFSDPPLNSQWENPTAEKGCDICCKVDSSETKFQTRILFTCTYLVYYYLKVNRFICYPCAMYARKLWRRKWNEEDGAMDSLKSSEGEMNCKCMFAKPCMWVLKLNIMN